MTDKVVDASAIAAMVFLEPAAGQMDRRLDGCRLFAPVLLPFEIMNVCLKKIRIHPQRREPMLQAYANFQAVAISLQDVDGESVIGLAQRHRLSAYDASYLWLARHLDIELVTLDGRLGKAAASSR